MQRLLTAITSFEWIILLSVLPFILFPTPRGSLILLIIPLLWGVRKWQDGRFTAITPLDSSLLLLALTLLISLYASYDLSLSLPKVIGVVYGIALFYAITATTSRSASYLHVCLIIFLLVGLAIVLVSLIGTDWGAKLPGLARLVARMPQFINNVPGAVSGFSPNEVAGTLLWFVPLNLTLALSPLAAGHHIASSKISKLLLLLFLWGLALLATATFILTQSRSGYLGFMAAGLVVVWGSLYKRRLVAWGLFVLAVGLSIGLVAVVGWSQLSPLLLAFGNDAIGAGGVTLAGRTEIWTRAIYAIEDFSLTGMGMNLFRYIAPVLYPFSAMPTNIDIAHAHNQFLQVGVDVGIPGLIAYIAIWLGLVGMLWQSWQLTNEPLSRLFIVGFTASLVASFVFGLTDTVALGAKPGFMFWFLLGLITGHYRLLVGANDGDNDS